MSRPRVLVVEHEDGTGPARVGERLTARGLRLDLCRPWAGDTLPAALDAFDGLLVLGGSMGPHDEDRAPWLPAVRGLLRQAVARDLPTLGICLGMELLTVACGGTVGHSARPEVGLCDLTALPHASHDELFAPLADGDAPLCAVQWHWEESSVLPEGAVPLLTSERCAHQAYRIGTAVWGVQFHPEVLAGDIATWGADDDGPLRSLGVDPPSVVARVAREEERLRALWGAFAERWGDIVAARGSAPARR
ncbi:type 1 glutamine amidotransferase [Streptomyces somaliensis]|uniref:type 1 glutamine amidotransferase n=1 Tax=Streptomyces somaliensis TaxID=78355 RepID=UPI0020CCCB41|nr:type 1 glutamine amidotransferase [Streptomyces somaliensis]MCP9945269.1 type 1 glutamine amidotransferase [Streptomyces somaliensis]MCP9961524.1 type 1 glutamine amidotransferase [Streptomyces somaliensis]MCP9974334.1 type 1 glutamine amidotransferase [Streptomyces somaliensis]